MIALSHVGIPRIILAFPSNLKSIAFPESPSWNAMGATGTYDASIFESSSNKVYCNNNEGMIAVFAWPADSVAGATRNAVNDNWNRYDIQQKNDWSDGVPVSFSDNARQSVKIMCARNLATWRYVAFTSNRGHYDPFVRASGSLYSDVAIIGSGVGGMSVAAALAGTGVEKITVVSAGVSASTSSSSTGVVWFPNASVHTVKLLQEAEGAPETDNDDRLKSYIEHGSDAYVYWESLLSLAPFKHVTTQEKSYDYTNYSTGELQGNSFASALCASQTQTCGNTLVQRLDNISSAHHILELASAVEMTPEQHFTIFMTNSSSMVIAPILVIATGGDGPTSALYDSDVVVAVSNNGFARTVQMQLGLEPDGNDSFYHLEFQSYNDGGSWSRRWFATDFCVPSPTVAGYDLCYDYSRRAQSLPHNVAINTTTGPYNCNTRHGHFWNTYMNSITNYSNCNPSNKLKRGIIDSKAGFKLNRNYESVNLPRLFASGTSAAAFTKDAYFAPGATLGLGLTTGYRLGQIIPERLGEFKRAQIGSTDGFMHRKCKAPQLFIAGAWAGAAGILVHRSTNTYLKFGHYILMPTAAVLITAGVFVARECGRNYVKQFNNNGAYHFYAGYVLLIVLWAQVALGVGIKVYRAYGPVTGSGSNIVGKVHRINGTILFILIAAQYLTVLYPRSLYALQYYEKNKSPSAGIAFTTIVGLYIVYVVFSLKSTKQKQLKSKVTEELLGDTARWL